MRIAYIQLLPTVFVRADAFPGLQAAQAGTNALDGRPADFSATEWDDEPTVPDRVIPTSLRRPLQTQPAAVLPSRIERELADRYEVEAQEMRRLKSWMETRGLRVSHLTKAVDFLARMRRAAAQEVFDDEPTVRIDLRKKENRHGIVRRAPL